VRALSVVLLCAGCGGAAAGEPAASPAPAAATAASPRRPAPRAARPSGEDLVRLTLLADVARVVPGRPVTLGARFDVAPGWHIYWRNPGQSGLPTEADFRAPPGFKIGPVRFPGPVRFESPGPITSYGYEGLAMLSAVAAAPDSLAGPTVQFSVQASWLACSDVCVPGRGVAEIVLDAARPGEAPAAAHAPLFARHADALPRPLAELGAAAAAWKRDQRQVVLALAVPGAERLEYFPASGEDLALVSQASVPGAGGQRLELTYKPQSRAVKSAGVLAVTTARGVRYYAVDLEEPSR
jgi:DsbC/DsbD-like thiol-disulfide interchange protein